MEEAAVISGLFRRYRMPLDTRYGTRASASRFMLYSSEPLPVTYMFQSCVDGLR